MTYFVASGDVNFNASHDLSTMSSTKPVLVHWACMGWRLVVSTYISIPSHSAHHASWVRSVCQISIVRHGQIIQMQTLHVAFHQGRHLRMDYGTLWWASQVACRRRVASIDSGGISNRICVCTKDWWDCPVDANLPARHMGKLDKPQPTPTGSKKHDTILHVSSSR